MTRQCTTKTTLRPGQSLRRHVQCGTTIVAASGAIRIVGAPLWLGERVVAEELNVREGEAHVARQSGWISITALTASEVVCVTQVAPRWPALARWRAAAAEFMRWIAPRTGRG